MTDQELYDQLRADVARLAASPQKPGVVYAALKRANAALAKPGVTPSRRVALA